MSGERENYILVIPSSVSERASRDEESALHKLQQEQIPRVRFVSRKRRSLTTNRSG
jgi:hypothetical protein